MRLLLIVSMAMLFMQCSKKDDGPQPHPEPDGYFRNSNEKWVYTTHQIIENGGDADTFVRQWTYTVTSKSFDSKLGEDVVALREQYVDFYLSDSFTQNQSDTVKRVMYDSKARRLVVLNNQNQVSEILIDFSDFSASGPCLTSTWNSMVQPMGKNQYRFYYDSKGDFIIEGIDLGLSDCHHFPPVPPYFSSNAYLAEFRYASDECGFLWKK